MQNPVVEYLRQMIPHWRNEKTISNMDRSSCVEISVMVVVDQFHSLSTSFSQYLIFSVRERPPRKHNAKANCRISETAIN